jgi:hypothetical protein
MIQRCFGLIAASALLLSAAEFWVSKPYTEWNDKDVKKMLSDSPWAKRTSVLSLEGPTAPGVGGPGGGGKGGGKGGPGAGGDESGTPLSEKGGGAAAAAGVQMPSAEVVISWPAALPMKQAIAKSKYGKEVESSPEAKKLLEQPEQYYVIRVSPLQFRGRTGDDFREALLKSAVLNIKGKDSIHAMDVQVNPHGGTLDLFFLFPRQRVLTVEDSEVEFSAKAGEVPLKQRFKLKDMVVNGKLEL